MKPRFTMEDEQFEGIFTFVRVIGSGSYGTVIHAVEKATGEECAVKVVEKVQVTPSRLEHLRKEASILSKLHHPNIVRFRQLQETRNNVYLVLEMIHGGTLADHIGKQPVPDLDAAKAMAGIFKAVHYLHGHGVIHRDLKPENILVQDASDLATVKIADFGLSEQFGTGEFDASDDYCGTVLFMAPEQIERKYYSKSVDIWSCGIIMAMLCCGKHPLKDRADTTEQYFEKLREPVWTVAGMSPPAQSLFLRLMRQQPIERYSAAQALKHPWILRDSSDVPLTSLEVIRMYNDETRLHKVPPTQLLWSLFVLGRLAKTIDLQPAVSPSQANSTPMSQLWTEASSESPVLNVEEVKMRQRSSNRSFSVRIRRTPSRKRPLVQKVKPPPPKQLLRRVTPISMSTKPRVLKPISITRRVNVSYSEY